MLHAFEQVCTFSSSLANITDEHCKGYLAGIHEAETRPNDGPIDYEALSPEQREGARAVELQLEELEATSLKQQADILVAQVDIAQDEAKLRREYERTIAEASRECDEECARIEQDLAAIQRRRAALERELDEMNSR